MASQKTEVRLDGQLCIAWSEVYRFNDRANGYWCPVGEKPGVAWVYALDKDLAGFNLSGPILLSLTAGKSVTFPRLYLDTAIVATKGATGDGKRVRALRLLDVRHLLAKFSSCNLAVNVRCPAPPTLSTDGSDPKEFYADSLNNGAAHTWTTAVKAIWDALPSGLVNAFPGLPFTPNGLPQNIRYNGVSAWRALHDLLGRLNCTTAYDPQADKFSIVEQGASQAGLTAAQALYPLPYEDSDPLNNFGMQIPATIRVYFHRQSQHFGTEPDTPQDSNWTDSGACESVDVGTGNASSLAGTVLGLFDDLPAIVDFNGNVTNQAALSQRAAERAAKWTAAARSSAARRYATYQGIAPEFTPGSSVSSVWWRDVGDGYLTDVDLHPGEPLPPWEQGGADSREHASDNFREPDFARHTLPVYPRNVQLVQVANNSKDPSGLMLGEVVSADPGVTFLPDGGSPVGRQQCLIADSQPGANGQPNTPTTRRINEYLFGRLNGTAQSAGQKLPLYIADNPPPLKHATLLADLTPGGQAMVQTADGDTILGNDWWSQQTTTAGTKVFLRFEAVQNSWWIITPPSQNPDETIITTWPYPPEPPYVPGDPNPPYWSSELALAVATSNVAGYGTGTAKIVRGAPTLAGARNNPITVQGPALTFNNPGHRIISGEILILWASNAQYLPPSQRYWVVRSEFGGRFLTKNTSGATWAKTSSVLADVYTGFPGLETVNPYGLPAQAVYCRHGDIPNGKWAWVNGVPNSWYVTAAEC
jgi:hypothetical protein